MAKIRKTYRWISVEVPKKNDKPAHTKSKMQAIKELAESKGLRVHRVAPFHSFAGDDFANGGTFYWLIVFSVDPPTVFIEDDDFYQFGIGYTQPFSDTQFYAEGEATADLKGGYEAWVNDPDYKITEAGEHLFSTLIVDKDSRPDLFETDENGNFIKEFKIVAVVHEQ